MKSDKNEPARLIDPETHQQCVLVRQEVYEHLAALLGDEAVCASADLLDKIMALNDANDPSLVGYQSISRERV
jgi:hypothetical protein